MSWWFSSSNTTSTSSIPSSLVSDLDKLNLTEERLKRYADESNTSSSSTRSATNNEENDLRAKAKFLRGEAVFKALDNIKDSMKVDLCFVLDCTGSMKPHIAAAKDCILYVTDYIKRTNPNIEVRVGFCGYRDYDNGSNRLQVFHFTDQHEQFKQYVQNVPPIANTDLPEDVLGGLNAAITQMNWQNGTRILLHIGDYPPHGRRFTNLKDKYPDGDPNGLTAESVLENMQSKNILYFFGKITHHTEKMLQVFRSIIGEFPVSDLVGGNQTKLVDKLVKATSSSITHSVSLTSSLGKSSKNIYSLQRTRVAMNLNRPDWNSLPLQNGIVMWYDIPETLDELKNPNYFNESELLSKSLSFKIASQPFSTGVKKRAYLALDIESHRVLKYFIPFTEQVNKEMVVKEYHVGQYERNEQNEQNEQNDSIEKYLEAVEIFAIAHFLSKKFNFIAKEKNVPRVNFLHVMLLRSELSTRYYTIEPKLQDTLYKRFNSSTGVITEFRPALEAFAHFTYEFTKGYLVVCDLQGIELADEFLLTDPAIHCIDTLRFGRTNFGEEGINQCFLANHRCNDICKKLELNHINSE